MSMSLATKALLGGGGLVAVVIIYFIATREPDPVPAATTPTAEQRAAASEAFRSGSFERPQPGKYEWTPPDTPKDK